jgi:hypothetical protein
MSAYGSLTPTGHTWQSAQSAWYSTASRTSARIIIPRSQRNALSCLASRKSCRLSAILCTRWMKMKLNNTFRIASDLIVAHVPPHLCALSTSTIRHCFNCSAVSCLTMAQRVFSWTLGTTLRKIRKW